MSEKQSQTGRGNVNTSDQVWLSAAIPPPEQFESNVTAIEEKEQSETDPQETDRDRNTVEPSNSHEQAMTPTDPMPASAQQEHDDNMTLDPNAKETPTQHHSSKQAPTPTTRPTAEVEIIGHIDADSKNISNDTVETYAVSGFSHNGKKRSKSRQNGTKNPGVETLKHSEKEIIRNGEKMKIDIKDQSQLDAEEITDQEEDYGSDDTASSISSIGDETMPGLEEVAWSRDDMSTLAEPDFDVWRLGRDSMVDHLEYMYHDLGVTRAWKIPRATLRMFLLGVRERYQDNPYHNFKHCFSVTQMTYSMICKLKLRHLLSVDDLGMMLTAAVCHDVDHPGLNNSYHSHAQTPLAILYNYKSILEQHHFAVTCRILTNKERNIFRNVSNRDEILNGTRELILATDLALHKDIMEEYKRNIQTFDFKNRSHVLSLLKIIIKCADVSNEVRPENVATPWVERLFSEYYEQSSREKRERLPVTAYMDPDQVDVTDSQEGFIKGMMLPMYTELAHLIVEARIFYVNPLKGALLRYEIQKRQRM